eukprot:m.27256 g.27256  ORF g.27256 m.27256 type:complete len:325 (+) comp15713_c0_seq1:253-1227(+)
MATVSIFGPAPVQLMNEHSVNPDRLTLLHSDFCPFANRAWIAMLEKEKSPKTPELFDEVHVAYMMGEKDPGTALLYGLGFKTVPAMIYKGQALSESGDIANFIDDLFPDISPLKPADPVMRFNMHRFMSSHGAFVSSFYALLMNQHQSQYAPKAAKFRKELKTIDDDLGKFKHLGPYYCGSQFTLADVSVFPFVEKALYLLPFYRKKEGFTIEKTEFPNVFTWFELVGQRPSVRIVTSDRSTVSLNTYCFEATNRRDYIRELYQCYAANEITAFKTLSVATGRPGFNPYRDAKKKHQTAIDNTKMTWFGMTYAFCLAYVWSMQA